MNKHPWKTHQGPFTSKQDNLEITKRLHIKCGFLDTEHLCMLPKTWLEYLQHFADFNQINVNETPVPWKG